MTWTPGSRPTRLTPSNSNTPQSFLQAASKLYAPRFAEPDLHARLLKRTVADQVVVDHEVVTRNFDAGVGTVEMVCIYVVKGDRIQSASFVFGSTVMRDA